MLGSCNAALDDQVHHLAILRLTAVDAQTLHLQVCSCALQTKTADWQYSLNSCL